MLNRLRNMSDKEQYWFVVTTAIGSLIIALFITFQFWFIFEYVMLFTGGLVTGYGICMLLKRLYDALNISDHPYTNTR